MKRRGARIAVRLAALALGMSFASAAALAQNGPYYPSDRKVNDNGSVYEPNSGASVNTRQQTRRARLINYAATAPQASQMRHYWPGIRKADDNGSVDEPGPAR